MLKDGTISSLANKKQRTKEDVILLIEISLKLISLTIQQIMKMALDLLIMELLDKMMEMKNSQSLMMRINKIDEIKNSEYNIFKIYNSLFKRYLLITLTLLNF